MIVPIFLSALVAAVNGAFWVRSYWTGDDFVLTHDDTLYNVTSVRGGWRFEVAFGCQRQTPLVHYAMMPHDVGDLITYDARCFRNHFGSWIGFARDPLDPNTNTSRFAFRPDWHYAAPTPPDWKSDRDPEPLDAILLNLPHRYVAAATAPLPLAYLVAVSFVWARQRRRQRHGQCATCGYDLRTQLAAASPRCPECGQPIPNPITPPAAH